MFQGVESDPFINSLDSILKFEEDPNGSKKVTG